MAFNAIPKPRALLQAKIFENDKPSWVFVCVLVVIDVKISQNSFHLLCPFFTSVFLRYTSVFGGPNPLEVRWNSKVSVPWQSCGGHKKAFVHEGQEEGRAAKPTFSRQKPLVGRQVGT